MAFTGNIRKHNIIFVVLLEILYVNGIGGRNFTDAELDQQLKILNKPYLESFKIGDDEIIDCVNIYEQPALSHPLLKGHKIQMKPSFVPKMDQDKYPQKAKQVDLLGQRRECPLGTVPIRRTRKNDLITNQILMKSLSKRIHNNPGAYFVIVDSWKKETEYNGVYARINVQNPIPADKNQFSETIMWVQGGENPQMNIIQVGWTVYKGLFGDSKTRLFTSWTKDRGMQTGCYNTLCPGFIQIHQSIVPGSPFGNISVFGGTQWEATYLVFRDRYTGHWWLVLGETYQRVGYWPKAIFTSLQGSGNGVGWGAQTYCPVGVNPPMGSGHFAEEGFRKAAYIRSLQYLDDQYNRIHPQWNQLSTDDTCSKYYTLSQYESDILFYGGPGGNCQTSSMQ